MSNAPFWAILHNTKDLKFLVPTLNLKTQCYDLTWPLHRKYICKNMLYNSGLKVGMEWSGLGWLKSFFNGGRKGIQNPSKARLGGQYYVIFQIKFVPKAVVLGHYYIYIIHVIKGNWHCQCEVGTVTHERLCKLSRGLSYQLNCTLILQSRNEK